MKNKKFTYYVLFPAVIIIWGIIIYKITVKDEDFKSYNIRSSLPKKEKSGNENDVYSLINNYPDPFFHDLPQTDDTFSSEEQEVEKPKVEKKWPAFHFDGYIVNGNKVRCHLTINGEDKIQQVQEKVIEDYVITAITPDSVKINCQGNSRWYKKE